MVFGNHHLNHHHRFVFALHLTFFTYGKSNSFVSKLGCLKINLLSICKFVFRFGGNDSGKKGCINIRSTPFWESKVFVLSSFLLNVLLGLLVTWWLFLVSFSKLLNDVDKSLNLIISMFFSISFFSDISFIKSFEFLIIAAILWKLLSFNVSLGIESILLEDDFFLSAYLFSKDKFEIFLFCVSSWMCLISLLCFLLLKKSRIQKLIYIK